jgi:hypothetical protein
MDAKKLLKTALELLGDGFEAKTMTHISGEKTYYFRCRNCGKFHHSDDETWEHFNDCGLVAFQKDVEEYLKELEENALDTVRMVELPDYGDLITLEEFIGACESGTFIDSDGTGYYATETQMSNIPAYPSDIIVGGIIYDDYTHVMWFNK